MYPGITTNQICWVAGLLEGEGSFSMLNTPRLKVGSTDLDVIRRARDIIHPKAEIHECASKSGHKMMYSISIHSTRSAEWMMTIYPLMGQRRKARIKEILAGWKLMDSNKRKQVQ